MVDWVAQMASLLSPLAEAAGKHVRAGETIHADDTPVPVLAPGCGKTKTGRLWVAVRDERPWGSAIPPAVYCRYAPDRKNERAEALLRDCRGYLHADAYAGYNSLYKVDPIHPISGKARLQEVACWAHSRRKIYEVYAAEESPAAEQILERIGALFAIEASIKGKTPGHADDLTCVYHAWRYDLKGNLKSVAFRRGVAGRGGMPESFHLEQHGLKKLRVDTFGDLVFGTLSPDALPLGEYIGNLIGSRIPPGIARQAEGAGDDLADPAQ